MSNKPVAEVKFGRIRAAVWANEAEERTFYSVTFSRLYKDKDDQWKDSTSFSREDLPLLMKVADRAHSYLYEGRHQEPEEKDE